jgi:hypothetical protein
MKIWLKIGNDGHILLNVPHKGKTCPCVYLIKHHNRKTYVEVEV